MIKITDILSQDKEQQKNNKKILKKNDFWIKEILLIWFEFIHFCDIDLNSTHEKLYAIYIEWTKLSEKENHSSFIWWLHIIETMIMKLCIKFASIASIQRVTLK